MNLQFWSLDCDIIEGPEEAGTKIATTSTPEEAKTLVTMLNNAWQRMGELGEIATSAHAIAKRNGEGTAWERFSARCAALGVGSITPKTFRVLPTDAPE